MLSSAVQRVQGINGLKYAEEEEEKVKEFLGIDVGSVSIKFALLKGDTLAAKVYLKNQGLIKTVQEGLSQLGKVEVAGVGITGSGKEFVSSLVGGDYLDSEVMCHCIGALNRYSEARTIIDVGGEDSKLILVRDGVLNDFQMNRSCGAGSGAMIETIASRLGISIEEVGNIALQSQDHLTLPSKCGIFMQSEVVSQLNKGRPISDILMGVCRGMVGNYLLLAKGKKLESPVVFQGAVAKNQAVAKAFEEALKCPIIIPEYPELAGAIGIALLTEESMNGYHTNFRGDAILNSNYRTEIAHCEDCENRCELLNLYCNGDLLAVSGSRCGKRNQ